MRTLIRELRDALDARDYERAATVLEELFARADSRRPSRWLWGIR